MYAIRSYYATSGSSVTVPAPTSSDGVFTYQLVRVQGSTGCSQDLSVITSYSIHYTKLYDTDNGTCTYTVQGTEFNPTAFADNCSGATIQNNYNSSSTLAGAVFNKGTTTVVWTVTDASGNTATCSFDVVVTDNEDPTITCVGNQAKDTDNGTCTYTVQGTEFDPTAFADNCSGATIRNNFV